MLSLQNGPFVSAATGYIPEMEQIISQLERSTLVTKFSWRKKVESKSMSIRRETNQVVWCRPSSGTKPVYDGAVDIREIKEVRFGKQSKDFEKWPEEAKKMEHLRCFVVYYGSEFKLRALSIAGKYNMNNMLYTCKNMLYDYWFKITVLNNKHVCF